MNIRTRHLGIMVYGGLCALIIFKEILTDPIQIVALVAPIVLMAGADKVEAIARGISGKDSTK